MFGLKAYWLEKKSKDEALAVAERAGLTKMRPKLEKLIAEPQ